MAAPSPRGWRASGLGARGSGRPGSHRAAPLLALVALASLAACGGGDPTSPVLSALELRPAGGVPPGGVVEVGANFDDADEDTVGGVAEVALRRDSEPRGRTFTSPIGGEQAALGRLLLTITLPAGLVPGTYELALTVVDSGGRRSNSLATTLAVIE